MTKEFAENTLPSIRNAYEVGAEYVEIDVHLTKEGKVAILHDPTLDRTTDMTGCIADKTYAEVAQADATKGSAASSPAKVPLLSEVLQITKEYGRKLNVEIKVTGDTSSCPNTNVEALVDATITVIEDEQADEYVFFSSFDFEALAMQREEAGDSCRLPCQ